MAATGAAHALRTQTRSAACWSSTVAEHTEVPAVALAAAVTTQTRADGRFEETEALERVVGIRLAGGGLFASAFALAAKVVLVHGLAETKIERHSCYQPATTIRNKQGHSKSFSHTCEAVALPQISNDV